MADCFALIPNHGATGAAIALLVGLIVGSEAVVAPAGRAAAYSPPLDSRERETHLGAGSA